MSLLLYLSPSILTLAHTPQWNTYGDPPNSDLLRRYGHVDLVPLPDEPNVLGNPADVVEISADLVVRVCTEAGSEDGRDGAKDRIDWWLEEGGDECVYRASYFIPSSPNGTYHVFVTACS